MIQADNFYAYRRAAENGHLGVSKSMLSKSSACFAYAEMHEHEYGELLIKPFIEETLNTLHRAAMLVSANEVFDIRDSEQAKICFYIMRNLIRRNDRVLDDDLRFLLSIPAVKALAAREVTPGRANELIRLAITTNNEEAASILLALPEVRALAEQNDYYRAQAQGQLDLATLARDRESSMTALTQGEQQRLKAAIKYYQPMLNTAGVPHLMDALREQLRKRYEAHPISIVDEQGTSITLPMDFSALQALHLNPVTYQNALIAYYQHKDHSAWRYILKPNPWIDPDASYVYVYIDEAGIQQRCSTFEEYQPLITMFWLAACDTTMPPTEGHTLEGRLDRFIDELALIGRSHNWDNTRINEKGIEEEYDDLRGDRPSCFSGVKRRLFQSVLGHPLISLLTQNLILVEIRDFARDYYAQINTDTKKQLQDAFKDYFENTTDMSETSKNLLASLTISDKKLEEFQWYLTQKYGAQFSEDLILRKLVHQKLFLKPDSKELSERYHPLLLEGLVGLCQMLSPPETTKPSEGGFYSRTPNQPKEDTATKEHTENSIEQTNTKLEL